MAVIPHKQTNNDDRDEAATLFIACEMSKAGWLLAACMPSDGRTASHKLNSGDLEGLVRLIGRWSGRESQAVGGPVQVVFAYEAGYDGFWLYRRLTAEGIRCQVMDPASLPVNRRARRVKTDVVDVAMLLRALMAWWRGDRAACRMVQVPTLDQEDARRTHRERRRLITERVQHVNRIKGLLSTQGIAAYQPLRADRRQRLDELRTGDGRPLPPCLRREVERELQRLELVLEQIAEVEAERDAVVETQPEADPDAAKVVLLTKLRAIGPEMATVLVREALFRSFASRKELAAYAGLTPSPYASGSVQRDQGVSKAGNPRLRTAMIELAWLWLRYQPGSALAQWFSQRVGNLKGRIRRITIVAVARKLLIALWRYVTTGLLPEGAALKPA